MHLAISYTCIYKRVVSDIIWLHVLVVSLAALHVLKHFESSSILFLHAATLDQGVERDDVRLNLAKGKLPHFIKELKTLIQLS